jgi:hypothetical protein
VATLWIGRLMSGLVVLALSADAGVQLFAPHVMEAQMAASGFPPSLALPLGIIILGCALVYLVPATAVLGAILITGFLGGAIATHFRLGEIGSPPQLICLALGCLTWGGLYLRDQRLRTLLPVLQPS